MWGAKSFHSLEGGGVKSFTLSLMTGPLPSQPENTDLQSLKWDLSRGQEEGVFWLEISS